MEGDSCVLGFFFHFNVDFKQGFDVVASERFDTGLLGRAGNRPQIDRVEEHVITNWDD